MADNTLTKMTIATLLRDSEKELLAAAREGRPLVVAYKSPCPCGQPGCKTNYSITVTPYTEFVHSSIRSIQ